MSDTQDTPKPPKAPYVDLDALQQARDQNPTAKRFFDPKPLPPPKPNSGQFKKQPRRPSGGPSTHKPFCGCNACQRKTQALLVAARGGRPELEGIDVEDPEVQRRITKVIYADRDWDNDQFTAPTPSRREQIARYVVLRGKGYTHDEIAEKLGLKPISLTRYITLANRQGWLQFDSVAERLEHEIVPKAVENVNYYMDARDKQMTIEVMKGTGYFRSHQAVQVAGPPQQTVLAIKFEAMPQQMLPSGSNVIEGSVIATPKVLSDAST